MTPRKDIVNSMLQRAPVLLLFAALALAASIACGADKGEAGSTATPPPATATATASPMPTATAMPSPSPTPTSVPEPVMLRGLTCTQLFPGVPPEPGDTVSFLTLSVTVTNTGDTDVPVKIGVLGGAIVGAEFFDATGRSLIFKETTLQTTSLAAGQSYQVSIDAELEESDMAETCLFVLIAENGAAMKFAGSPTAEVEKIFAP